MLIVALATLGLTAAASAQTPQSQSATPPAAAATPQPTTPRVDCRGQAESKGLSGQDMRDAVSICVAEQRLACTKEAVDKKVVGKARREFVRACAGRPGGARRGDRQGRQKEQQN
jgi:hypothetical protein